MSENDDVAARGRREGGWDMRVVFLKRRQCWWWSAWRASTSTELYGFADTQPDAWSAMNEAISGAQMPNHMPDRRSRPASGAA